MQTSNHHGDLKYYKNINQWVKHVAGKIFIGQYSVIFVIKLFLQNYDKSMLTNLYEYCIQ